MAYPNILGFSDLTSLYDAVIFANGSISDRKLGISGEDSIISAREFVGWINGDPYAAQKDWNALFRNVQTVVIIGHGNVALDVARILLKAQTSELATTDISLEALETLKSNPVREIRLIGRRSPAHVLPKHPCSVNNEGLIRLHFQQQRLDRFLRLEEEVSILAWIMNHYDITLKIIH